ncbi:adenylate/guanylate cyclase domain-containing protein [Ruegeria sp. 2012CJ41-6]|uniref:Adenylate/guanylate cyclase domain-containing protein n=1 Tax=Ruegeria spongiae TaxID=2942209 RepID=A0ABT0Q094_9RHOB|nr:adenylate/guanylate cyclase domain-containing protein [Ruegeria spongiae]MCL6282872.1 adenylate/guanylate cyclase domain-containing protein [Ruegeria spongiae]
MIVDYIRIGHAADDSLRLRRLKSMSTVILLVIMCMALGFFLEPDRSLLYRVLDVAVVVTILTSLSLLHHTRKVETVFYVFAPVFLTIQFIFMLLNGNREGDVLPFLVMPAAAVVVIGPKKSRPWFAACLLVMFALPFLDSALPQISLAVNQNASNPTGSLFQSPLKQPLATGESLAMTIGVFFIYFLVFSGYRQLEAAREVIEVQKARIEHEYDRSERLLENILPAPIAERLKQEPDQIIADDLLQVTILFADIVDFTPRASQMRAAELVSFLNRVFTQFDDLADRHGLEKIKTIGDAYMIAGGMPEPRPDHASAVADMALEMLAITEEISREMGEMLTVRIGIHTGPAVAGVIGTRKFFYDVWGDTVNMASRLESYGTPGRIQVAQETYDVLSDLYRFEKRGTLEIKGKGEIQAYYLIGPS